ncbi:MULTISPECIES: hypothetical protein [unclassified Streptomyces]|uniref:hypothetical protein n=1 Tax=unclassified Streptomyces TaxID=2593676 RepID=UPI002E2E4875|nr:hypothetical protein [Streptomyces sp. NBC_00223]
MRRIPALLGAAAVLTPVLLVNAPSAAAASNSLTVTTLGRDGTKVTTAVQAYNTKTFNRYYLTSGKAKSLPKGTYDVITDIWNTRDSTDTLGGARVTVSGAAKLTIDARKGRPVKASLSPKPPSGDAQWLRAEVCVTDGPSILAWADPGSMYVIPSSLSTLGLAYGSTWGTDRGDGDQYLVMGTHKKGLPSGVSTTFRQSALATVKVTARSGPVTGEVRIELDGDQGNPCGWGVLNVSTDRSLPYSFTAHVPPGKWEVLESSQDFAYNDWHTYKAGKSYGVTVNRAVWGPGGELPYTSGSGRLYLNTTPMFVDPSLTYGTDYKATYKLTKAGKTLYTKTAAGYATTMIPVLKSAGWYTLAVSATRHPSPGQKLPAGSLSTKSTLSLHFYADAKKSDQIRAYLTRFTPAGLSSYNRAKPGSTTTVALGMQRNKPQDHLVHRLSDSVKKVQAWYSTDAGKTWHTAKVKHSGGAWSTAVHNPKSGRVSLRSKVTDSHSDTATTTVLNAYAIG